MKRLGNMDTTHTVIDRETRVPLYMLYAIGVFLVSAAFFIAKLEVNQSNILDRLNLQKDAILQLRTVDQKLADTQYATAVKLAEVAVEVKLTREMQTKKK